MNYTSLEFKISQLINGKYTLLWLEGSKTDQVSSVKLTPERLVLRLTNGTSKIVKFDKYAVTKVGLQFWNKGRAGVLYRWEITALEKEENDIAKFQNNDGNGNPNSVA